MGKKLYTEPKMFDYVMEALELPAWAAEPAELEVAEPAVYLSTTPSSAGFAVGDGVQWYTIYGWHYGRLESGGRRWAKVRRNGRVERVERVDLRPSVTNRREG